MTATRTAERAPARRPARPARAPHLRVVPRDYRSLQARQRRARRLGTLAVVLVGVMVFGLVVAHVALGQGQLRLDRLTARAAADEARNERLQLEVAQLESPERIVAAAQERLGMVPPPGVTYLSAEGPVNAPSPATTSEQATGPRSRPASTGGTRHPATAR